MNPAERKTFFQFRLILSGLILIICLTLFYLSRKQKNSSLHPISVAPTSFEFLPPSKQFSISELPWKKDVFSQKISKGSVTYINYWAEWCEPCLKEIPFLQNLSKSHKNLDVIFVNVDNKDDRKKAQFFWKKNISVGQSYYSSDKKKILQFTRGLPYHQIYNQDKKLVMHFTKTVDKKSVKLMNFLKKLTFK